MQTYFANNVVLTEFMFVKYIADNLWYNKCVL